MQRSTSKGPCCVAVSFGIFASIFLIEASVAEDLFPQGEDFQINALTPNFQQQPSVAVGKDGQFVVTWWSDVSSGDDSSNSSVQARIFSREGTPTTSDIQVNTYTSGFQNTADVAIDDDKRFVIVWHSSGSLGDDSDQTSIQGKKFDSDGQPIGGEFQVNTYTTSRQLYPGVARAPGGEFAVAWYTEGLFDVQARMFDPDGIAESPDFIVNTYQTNPQRFPAVAIDATGQFVVAWQSIGSPEDDNDSYSVHGRAFDSTGQPLIDQFQLNSYTTANQLSVAIDSALDGSFVAVWPSGDYATDLDIRGRRFSASGMPIGTDFVVNTYTTGLQTYPRVAMDDDGDFLVVWQSAGSPGSDASAESIVGREFASDGTPRGDDFQINTYTTSEQRRPRLSFSRGSADRRFVVVWHSFGSSGSDTSTWSIQGRIFVGSEIFADGFESGDTSAWD